MSAAEQVRAIRHHLVDAEAEAWRVARSFDEPCVTSSEMGLATASWAVPTLAWGAEPVDVPACFAELLDRDPLGFRAAVAPAADLGRLVPSARVQVARKWVALRSARGTGLAWLNVLSAVKAIARARRNRSPACTDISSDTTLPLIS